MTALRVMFFALAAACLLPGLAVAQTSADFQTWLTDFRNEASEKGISPGALDIGLAGLEPIPRVLELDQKQPEHTVTFDSFIDGILSPARIAEGRRKLAENEDILQAVADRYGVPARVIVALWGIETTFGANSGKFPVLGALATLAYDGRRSAMFRNELIEALRIVDEDHVPPSHMIGSWAGAMGQNQFMPSTYRRYGVSFDPDGGHGDIWKNPADVFASTANYLSQLGWNRSYTWGREVQVPDGISQTLVGLDKAQTLPEWSALGVLRLDGGALPKAALNAALIMPDGAGGRAFLVYDNYRTFMQWNRSTYFATAVGLLSDAIGQ
jgi:membrane-bound lytic murein transglycosylase B